MVDVSHISPDIFVLQKKVQKISDLLGGTQAMRDAGKTYLHQMELESDPKYKARLSRSTLYPALSETLSQMCGRVFFEPINTSAVANKIRNDIFLDVDLEGNNIDVFAANWFYSGLAYGISYALVDYTKVGNAQTLADEKALGARPYLVHIKPQSVLGFKHGMIGGKRQLTQFRYQEFITVDDGEFGTKTIRQINVYEIGRVRKYQETTLADGKGGFVLVEDILLKAAGKTLSTIPIAAFITKKTDQFFIGEPPLMDLADLNIKHWQSQSDQDNILNTARVPLLARFGSRAGEDMKIGDSVIEVPEDGDLRYIEHSGTSINAGQASLKELESQMRVAGAKLLDKTVLAMTDSQAREEQSKEISLLRLYANRFEDALDLALDYIGMWLGISEVGNVEISGNIDADFDPAASMDTVIKMNAAGVLSKQTVFDEAKRRGLLSDSTEWEEEQVRVDSEGLDGGDFGNNDS
ncbi:DUF4055 domain-containing protein [Pasteurellaceae bacterium USgator11]|nr:DUF4055 domain-containing protein [Pasteurellaceae bacterium USgator41]TNG96471.1 DUF4055 domain-containing protein [Pasteurellaceae bacterium UScroc12]TNH00447.1 DUF4055 domain-containing protein [Pasteurellaceae bacterium UScroc31]TNH01722.1 DUF4055 domain-containing protein [Pasteurellaceae bacterium USgator11]